MGAARRAWSTRSRSCLPGLKCGTYFAGRDTGSPDLGLRPTRGGRKCSEKLPNPRISMRSPLERVCAMYSRIVLTASSTSLYASCAWRLASASISSDLVMFAISREPNQPCAPRADRGNARSPGRPAFSAVIQVLFEYVAELCTAARIRRVLAYRRGLLVRFLGAHGNGDRALLAIHRRDLD